MIEIRRKIVFSEPGSVELVDEPCPQPGPGQLLVQTTRSIISTGTELTILRGKFTPGSYWDRWVKYPINPGYLNCGIVAGIGEGVTGFKLGDRVASEAAHASYALVGAHAATGVPEGVSDEDAAFTRLGLITQVGIRAARPVLGERVVVIGAGLLGQLVIQYARIMGARQIIAIDMTPARLELARQSGATDTLCGGAVGVIPQVERLTGGGADTIYDVTGHPAVLSAALRMPRRFGTVVLLGDAAQTEGQNISQELLVRGIRLLGAHAHHPPAQPSEQEPWSVGRVQELFLHYVQTGQMRVGPLITHRFAAADAAGAYGLLQQPGTHAMGVVLDWR